LPSAVECSRRSSDEWVVGGTTRDGTAEKEDGNTDDDHRRRHDGR
jgi:hypothetical protein